MQVGKLVHQLLLTSVKDDGNDNSWEEALRSVVPAAAALASLLCHCPTLFSLILTPVILSYSLSPPTTCSCIIIKKSTESLLSSWQPTQVTLTHMTTSRCCHICPLPSDDSGNLPWCGLSSSFHHFFMRETGICALTIMSLSCRIGFLQKCAAVSWVMDLFHLSLLLAIRPLPSQKLPRAVTHFKTIYSYNCAVKNAVKGGSNTLCLCSLMLHPSNPQHFRENYCNLFNSYLKHSHSFTWHSSF